MDIIPGIWRYPQWEDMGEGVWWLRQYGTLVGEAYPLENGGFKWHCKTSDWRDTGALSIQQAMAECECSFWKDAWENARSLAIARAEPSPPSVPGE